MAKKPISEFEKSVKFRLIELGEKQKWLLDKVNKDTGLFLDSSYLYKIFNGSRSAPKIKESICKILEIPIPAEKETRSEKQAQ